MRGPTRTCSSYSTAPAGTAGEIAGYAHLDPTDPVAGPSAEVVVHPAHRGRGFGRMLVEAALEAAPEHRLRLWAHGDHPAARALAASLGFSEARRLEQWRRSLRVPLPDAPLPPGVRLRTFQPGADDEAWLALNAAAFADHPEQGSWTLRDLHARMAEAWFDPQGFLLAETEDGELAGFHWTKVHGGEAHEHGHGHEAIGEVYVVGVSPTQQGRGLGRALTRGGTAPPAQPGAEPGDALRGGRQRRGAGGVPRARLHLVGHRRDVPRARPREQFGFP